MPNDNSIFFINYFTMIALACSHFPGWDDVLPTFIGNDPTENIALLFIIYAIVTGGWFMLREMTTSFVRAVMRFNDWRRSDSRDSGDEGV